MDKLIKIIFIAWLQFFTPTSVAQILIVHPDIPNFELSRNNIRSIFAMRTQQWPDGNPIHLFVIDDNNSLHTSFCKHVLGMFPYQLRGIWDRQIFSGTGIAPTSVSSVQEMREQVSNTPGAIGYIESDQLNSSVKPIGELL